MSRFAAMLGPAAVTEWRTPRWLFDRVNASFAFTVDAASTPDNAMLPRYWTRETDGLAQPWSGERVWCNPPYGRARVGPWVAKASRLEAELAVLFLPVRTSADWWRSYVAPFALLRYLPQRVHFEGAPHNAPFDSCLAIYLPEYRRATVPHRNRDGANA